MVVPYTNGLSESLKKVCSKHRVQVYSRGGKTIRSLLVAPKEDPILKKSGVVYKYKYDRVECGTIENFSIVGREDKNLI